MTVAVAAVVDARELRKSGLVKTALPEESVARAVTTTLPRVARVWVV